MNRRSLLRGIVIATLAAFLPAASRAEDRGTPDDAKAMVAKAIELYKAKGKGSFKIMNRGESTGFRKGDIYIFVFSTGPDAKILVQGADQKRVGVDVAGLKDSDGKFFGKEMLSRVTADGVWVDYKRTNPATNKEEMKSSWVVLYDGYVFGCGVYKTN